MIGGRPELRSVTVYAGGRREETRWAPNAENSRRSYSYMSIIYTATSHPLPRTVGTKMTTPPRRSPPLRGRGHAGLRALAPMVNIHERSPVPACVPAHPDPSSSISPDDWRRLEGATFSVMCKIHPTVSSQHLRARVIDYVQRLFRLHHDGYQVLCRLPSSLLSTCMLVSFYCNSGMATRYPGA